MMNTREDLNSLSPISTKKIKLAAGAPAGSNVPLKLFPVVQRTTFANDLELSHSTSTNSAAVCANNHEFTPSPQLLSPPVTQWASQRPKKPYCFAGEKIFVPIVSSNVERCALDATSNRSRNETWSGLARQLSTNSPQEVILTGDRFSSPALSESVESGATETKIRDNIKKTDVLDKKTSSNIQKVSSLPPRKNKLIDEDNHEDYVRMQGRTSQDFTSTRSLISMKVENLRNVGPAKQLGSARLGLEKTENKVGHPLTRKPTDRKPYTRQKQTTSFTATNFYDDEHKELVAAAAAVTDPALCFSSPFWKQMEPYFGLISDSDLAYLKQQGNPVLSPDLVLASSDIPLRQRTVSALFSEEETGGLSSGNDKDHVLVDTDVSEKGLIDLECVEYAEETLLSDQTMETDTSSLEFQYRNMSINERLILELEHIGIFLQPVPNSIQKGNEEASEEIGQLKAKYFEQVTAKKASLFKLFNSASEMRMIQEKEFEERALDKLTAMAYGKYMASRGPNSSGRQNTSSKMAKQAAMALVKRTLERCQLFEKTSKSCFSDPFFKDIFISGSARLRDELPVHDATGTYQSPSVNNYETPKICRTSSGKAKRERKTRMKPKRNGSQLSAVNDPANKLAKRPKAALPLHPGSGGNVRENNELLEDPIDLSHLLLPGMDVFGVSDDLDDVFSWLNNDDELPVHDGFDGLQVPMDDLSDLNMKF